jgi:ABC-2 type transport system ATP-binding protein
MGLAVKIKNVSVTLGGHFKALSNINLDLPVGKTIGFIGPSGAGKTTLIRGIVGSLSISSGEIIVFDMPAGSAVLREQVSYMTQELSVYPDLTVKENLKYFITMTGQPRKASGNTLKDVLELVDMTNKHDSLVSDLLILLTQPEKVGLRLLERLR